MTMLYQVQYRDSKEVLHVDTMSNCYSLCEKANAITKKPTLEVVPASLASISKFDGGRNKKPIFTIEDIRMAEMNGFHGDDSDDDYLQTHKQTKVYDDWRPESIKQKVANYLSKFSIKPIKKIEKKKK